jgi:simple sugar transport system permease protein
MIAMCLSGALAAGVALNQIIGYHHRLLLDFVAGAGFTGIAVALLARLSPAGIVPSAVLFGALEAGAGAMQRDAGIPAVAVYVAEAVMIVSVLLAAARSRGRTSEGPNVQAPRGATA